MKLIQTKKYLLLIDEEAEIEEWDFYYDSKSKPFPIKQSIENSHKDFKSCKIIAYYPLTKEAKELDLPLLPKHDIEGFRVIQDKQFSLEDIEKTMEFCIKRGLNKISEIPYYKNTLLQSLSTQQLPKEFIPEYINKNIEDLIDMYGNYNGENLQELHTIINLECKEELVGTYKY